MSVINPLCGGKLIQIVSPVGGPIPPGPPMAAPLPSHVRSID